MKFARYIKKRRAMLAMALTSLTFLASPFNAHASNITTKDGVALTAKDNVYDVAIQQKLSDKVGVNKFTNFELDGGHIANIQFDKLTTVANLVDNRVSINGVVNALRDGKIGGNLYFLSPEGIAVGATGVINAGSFTGIAADKEYFDKLSGMTDAKKFTDALLAKNIVNNNDSENGIDIQGVINAPGGISLHAAKIDVGSAATLRTNASNVDFKKVVNITSGNNISVNSGITGGLDATYKDGDIILSAHAEQIFDDSKLKEVTDDIAQEWDKISEIEASVDVNGTLDSAKNIDVKADSVIVFSEGEKFNLLAQMPIFKDKLIKKFNLDCSVNFAYENNAASVNIGKTANISSVGDIKLASDSKLNAKIKTVTPAKGKGTEWIPATAVGVIAANNNATVNVEGKINSGGSTSINATTNTSLKVDAKTKTDTDKNGTENDFFEKPIKPKKLRKKPKKPLPTP